MATTDKVLEQLLLLQQTALRLSFLAEDEWISDPCDATEELRRWSMYILRGINEKVLARKAL